MKGIIPQLWYDKEAQDAVDLYTSLFENSRLKAVQELEDTPSGDTNNFSFELAGQPFGAINGGPYVTLNPSISLMVMCQSKEEVDEKWNVLKKEGKILMPLQKYDFAEYYGWVQDRFGLSWQLMYDDMQTFDQKILPHFLFTGDMIGKAREAMEFYTSIFDNSSIELLYEYQPGEAEHPDAEIGYGLFRLNGMAFNGGDDGDHSGFAFNEAFSLMVSCENQEEIDYYWEKLSAVPEAEVCGWLKDKYGVSWQIVPEQMDDYLINGTREQINRVTQAFLKMKKMDLAELERAYKGE